VRCVPARGVVPPITADQPGTHHEQHHVLVPAPDPARWRGWTAAAAGVGSLTGCDSSGTTAGNNASVNSAVALPTYVPFEGAKPDLAATEDGVEAGFYAYLSGRPTSVSQKPGDGSQKVTGMANIYVPPPSGPDQNAWWAGLNERLGVDLDMIMVPTLTTPRSPPPSPATSCRK